MSLLATCSSAISIKLLMIDRSLIFYLIITKSGMADNGFGLVKVRGIIEVRKGDYARWKFTT